MKTRHLVIQYSLLCCALCASVSPLVLFFFFIEPAPPGFSPLPLHAALRCEERRVGGADRVKDVARHHDEIRPLREQVVHRAPKRFGARWTTCSRDRKSTRLNSSHLVISYAVFCLKKEQQ